MLDVSYFGCKKKEYSSVVWRSLLDKSHFCVRLGRGTEFKLLRVKCKVSGRWWFGVLCRLLVLIDYVFWSLEASHQFTRKFKNTMFPSAVQLYGEADFNFQLDLAPALTAISAKSSLHNNEITVNVRSLEGRLIREKALKWQQLQVFQMEAERLK